MMNEAQTSVRRRRQSPEHRRRFAISPDAIKGPLGVIGGLLILAGGSYYAIFQGFDTTARIITAAGILLLGVAIAIDPEAVWGKLTTRNMRYGGNTLAMAALFIGILVLVNVLGARRPERWDLTANKALSLSDQTIQLLGQIPQPVVAVAFMQTEDSRRTELENLLYEMQVRSNGQLTYEVLDPRDVPGYAQQLGVLELGTTVFVMGEKKQQVSGTREADLATGLVKLVQPNPRKAYFTTGHQERRIDGFEQDSYGQIKTQLESRNFSVENLSLFTTPEIPADASMVVIAGPKAPFTEAEVQALGAYVERGGDLMIMVDPGVDSGLGSLLSRWGIEAGKSYVAEGDPQSRAASPFNPVVLRPAQHKVTEKVPAPLLFPTSTYLTLPPPGQAPQGWRATALAQTTERSWAETDANSLRNPQAAQFDEGADVRGPLTLVAAIEQNPDPATPGAEANVNTPPKSRVLVFGTSLIAANEIFRFGGQVANVDLFVNGSSWLVGDDELISIQPRPADNRSLFLTNAQRNFIMLSSIVLMPALVLAVGILVWWSRR